jgi:hypothetical protein
MPFHFAGRLIRATASPTRDGTLLRVDLHDWDESGRVDNGGGFNLP